MISEIKKLSNDQWFAIISLIMAIVLSFLFAFTVFRYWQLEVCKMPMQVGNFGYEDIYKSKVRCCKSLWQKVIEFGGGERYVS